MRSKSTLLSAVLGAVGSVSVIAQSNVYSLNAVGYVSVACPPGFNIVTCPLITSPDNTIGTVLNNARGALTGSSVYFWFPTATPPHYSEEIAKAVGTGKFDTTNANGWSLDGTNLASPGVAFWFGNNGSSNITLTFMGTVPSGPITNTLVPGFNLVGSVVPMSGDLISNSISALTNYHNTGDEVFTYNPLKPPSTAYTLYLASGGRKGEGGHGYNGDWTSVGDPTVPNVGQGFWYANNVGPTVNWVENYSVGQ